MCRFFNRSRSTNQVVDFVVLTSGPNRVNNIIMSQSEHVHISVNNIVIPGSTWAHAAIEGNTQHTLSRLSLMLMIDV